MFAWVCISASSVGDFIRIKDRLRAERYLQILKEHGGKIRRGYTAQSSDINIIEHVWNYLDREKPER